MAKLKVKNKPIEVPVNPSLATGLPLTAETFADFVKRLQHDCRGEGVREHCTADAMFIVEEKVIVSGIDRDYTDNLMVFVDDQSWFSPKAYWDDLDRSSKAALNKKSVAMFEAKFLQAVEYEQWQLLDTLDDHTVTGYAEEWRYVCAHLTNDAAEAFIRRKQHDYRNGLRVAVESQYWAWEFNAIKNAIMDGTLVYQEKAAD